MATPHNFLAELVGCFATPIAENPTVAMIEAAFHRHGMNARYINCEVQPEALGEAARGARAMGWRGFNCSIPHKVAIIPHLDGLGELATTIGAVNCAVRRGSSWIGENTDGVGFMKSLAHADRRQRQVDRRFRRRRRGARNLRRGGVGGRAAWSRSSTAALARGAELTELINDKTSAKADFVPLEQDLPSRRRRRRLRQRNLIGLYPDVEDRLERRFRRRPARRGDRRRDTQSAAHAVPARGRGARPEGRSTGWACWSIRASSRSATGSASTSTRASCAASLEALFGA